MLTVQSATARLFEYPGHDCPTSPITHVEGVLPPLPEGTWYLNGPGAFQRGGESYRHWLDGDGLIRAVTLGGECVSFASRFVRTRKYCEESRIGRPLYRTFGTAFPDDHLNARETGIEGPANVAIVKHGSHLIALGEQGVPWLIDGQTLATTGPYTGGGALTPVTPFAAHAKVDPLTGDLFNFGVSFAHNRPELNVFRFDSCCRQVFRSQLGSTVPVPFTISLWGPPTPRST